MEDGRSVNSPRRTLSFSKNRRATVSFFDPDDNKASGFGVSGDHGPKLSEVYGFVGSISTVVASVIFVVWAYVPDPWLHSIGIFYYPNKYWAVALPTYAIVTVAMIFFFYMGLNFMATPPPTSFDSMFGSLSLFGLLPNLADAYSREPSSSVPSTGEDEQPIEPISDIGISRINEIMFKDFK